MSVFIRQLNLPSLLARKSFFLLGPRATGKPLLELRAYLSYRRCPEGLSFWRSKHGQEVDMIVGDELAIETKATRKVTERDRRGLKALQEERLIKKYYLVSQDSIETIHEGIHAMRWKTFMEHLWLDKLL